MAILEVEGEPGSKLRRIAPWDCFGYAFSTVLAIAKLRRNLGKILPPKQYHSAIRRNYVPVSRQQPENGQYNS